MVQFSNVRLGQLRFIVAFSIRPRDSISVSPLPDKSQNYQIYKRLDGGGWLYLAEWSALALHRNDILKAVKRYYKMWGV